MRLPLTLGQDVFAVSTINTICETNPVSGACLADPAEAVIRRLATDEVVTYTVFVSGTGSVAVTTQ